MKFVGLVRIGRDAELKSAPNGEPVCTFAAAYEYGKKPAEGYRPSQWVDITLWGKRAESAAQYLVKGQQIVATLSELHQDTYKKKDGTEATKLRAKLDDWQFVGTRPQQVEDKPAPKTHAEMKRGAAKSFAEMDDDLPF